MPRPDWPATIMDFQERFATEAACLDYLAACRWPEGFRCPACGGARAWVLERRHLWECADCHQQTSVTAGTVMHGTHRGVGDPHLQVYLDEYVFRHNRRRTPMAAFQTLLGLGALHAPTTYAEMTSRQRPAA